MQTANDHFPDKSEQCIEHLISIYHWGKFEAQCYFYYESYDPIDWIDYE